MANSVVLELVRRRVYSALVGTDGRPRDLQLIRPGLDKWIGLTDDEVAVVFACGGAGPVVRIRGAFDLDFVLTFGIGLKAFVSVSTVVSRLKGPDYGIVVL